MSSTRDRNGPSVSNFGLQDFGALSAADRHEDTAIQQTAPSGNEHLAAMAPVHEETENSAGHVQAATPHARAHIALDTTHHASAAQTEASHASNGVHASELSSAPHTISLDHSASIISVPDQYLGVGALGANSTPQSISFGALNTDVVTNFDQSSRQGDSGGGSSDAHVNGAPPPVGAVTGELWAAFGGQGAGGGNPDGMTDFRIEHADTDNETSNSSVVQQMGASGGQYSAVGLDTSAGLSITMDGTFHLHVTNLATGTDLSSNVIASTVDQDVVNAFVVNPVTNTIFADLDGYDYLTHGGDIIKITYNQTTGAISNPYTFNDGTHTGSVDTHGILLDSTSSGGVYQDGRSFVLSHDGSTLYYVDDDNDNPGGAFSALTNGIYKVSTSGDVGDGTAPTPTLLSMQSQFPTNDSNGYITGITVNEAQGIIYFTTDAGSEGINTSQNGIWWMPITGGSATKMTIPGNVAVDFPTFYGDALAYDSGSRELYYSDKQTGEIVQFVLSADGKSFASGSNFALFDSNGGSSHDGGFANDLVFDDLPTLATLSGTSTEAVQGGSAITLLTALPTISDPDNVDLNHVTITVSNAQAGDNLFANGQQSGTVDSGKITVTWNSTTHTLTLSGDVAFSDYQTILDQISFQDSGTDNSSGSHPTRTITWVINDGVTDVHASTADPNEQTTTLVIDRAPTLTADSYSPVQESGTQLGTSGTGGTGVLGNDTDKDGDSLAVTAVNGNGANVGTFIAGTYGHLQLNANGSFEYDATMTTNIDNATVGSHPVDTFTYTVSDGLGGVSTTTVSFTINRAPTVTADAPSSQALESGAAVVGNVLSNDSDKDGDTLVVSAVNGGAFGSPVAGTYGHLTMSTNGSYSYVADNTSAIDSAATGAHLTDTFTYTDSDGHGGTTTTTLTITLDRAPTVAADSGTAVESASGNGNVLTNDSDRDGDTLAVSAVNGSAGNIGTSVAGTYGHITINADGSYTYNADNTSAIDSAATGSHLTDTFTYTANDGHGGTTTTSVTITLDRAPTVVADANTALEAASDNGNVLTNDSDRDGDSLVVSAVNGSGGNVGTSTAGTYGHIQINSDGTYSYVADNTTAIDSAATGSHLTDTFTYTASDGHGGTTTTSITITLDRAPTVVADAGAAVEGASGTGNVLSNDSDRDGDSLVVSAVNGSAGNIGTSVAGTYGHITINSDGSYTYNADNTSAIDSAATGSHLTDTFTYTDSDGHGGTTTSTITVTLDRAPTVVNDNNSVAESNSVSDNAANGVLANDSDRDGDTLTVSAITGGSVGSSVATTYGHITMNADGSYSYVADNTSAIDSAPTGSHPIDTITFTVSDGQGGTTTETLSITIDRPAVAAADALSTFENTEAQNGVAGNANLLANDSDKDGDAITITAVNGAAGNVGTQIHLASGALLTVNADGTYTYDPNHAFDYLAASGSGASNTTATDTFTYTVDGGSTVTVTITINGVDSNDTLVGTTGNDTLVAGIGNDIIYDDNGLNAGKDPHDTSAGHSGGTDSFSGGTGNDAFYMGGNLTAADSIDGGTGSDRVILNGDYSAGLVFTATTMVNVEALALVAGHDYNLTIDNATVLSGQTMRVQAATLGAGDNVTFDASNDTTGGRYIINTGAGNDVLTGGMGNDVFRPGTGNDTINGGGGNDKINMVGNLTAADSINGGDGNDTLVLKGDYSAGVVFGANTVQNVETIYLTNNFSYNLTMNAVTVAAGDTLTLRASSLGVGDNVTFDGSADTAGGNFVITTGDGNDVLTGGIGNDTFRPGAGNDTIHGGGGNDVINMAGNLTAADSIDGGDGTDVVLLDGNYAGGNALTFGATTITNVEQISLEAGHDYNLTFNVANVLAGQSLTIKGDALGAGDNMTIDGSALAGALVINGGAGTNVLIGGAGDDIIRAGDGTNSLTGGGGADLLFGGAGADTFNFNLVSDSTSTSYDTIKGFDASNDHIHIVGTTVNAINAEVIRGVLNGATFDTDLAAAIGAGQLGAHDAVLFDPNRGTLHGHTFLIVDMNGIAGYQAGQDLVIDITGADHLTSLTTATFI